MSGFSWTKDSITAAWLSDVLDAKVNDFTVSFLEGGVLSDAFRVHDITYDPPLSKELTSVVVKLPSSTSERRDFALAVNAYAKELNFFRELAADVPIRSPEIYHIATDGSEAAERFVLVMEDLTNHSKVFDQVLDPPDETYARKISLEAARLHAKYWRAPETRLPWIGTPDGRYVFSLDALCRMSPTTLTPFLTLWEKMYGCDLFDGGGYDDARELTEILCGPKCAGIHDRIYDILSSRPHTLLHGDMRADNVFRTMSGAPAPAARSDLTFVDWQVIHAGPPGPEFTQMWMHSLEPEVRRKERLILEQYHHRRVELNPASAAYTYEMLLEDYALSFCFWWTAIISIGVGTLPNFDRPEGARMKQLWDKGAERSLIALTELDCLARIKNIAAGLPDDVR